MLPSIIWSRAVSQKGFVIFVPKLIVSSKLQIDLQVFKALLCSYLGHKYGVLFGETCQTGRGNYLMSQTAATMLKIWWNAVGVDTFSSSVPRKGRGYVGVNLLMRLKAQVTGVSYSLSLLLRLLCLSEIMTLTGCLTDHKAVVRSFPTEEHSCQTQKSSKTVITFVKRLYVCG